MKLKTVFTDTLYILVGSFIFAVSVNIFTAPNNIVLGGFTGIGTMINFLTGIPIGLAILACNLPVFIWGYKSLGFSYIGKTIFATLSTSVMIDITAPLLPAYSGDYLITVVIAGVLAGAGLSLIFMRGATTGGTDMIASLISRYFRHIPIGRLILSIDFLVVIISAFVYDSLENAAYATMILFIMSSVIDALLYGSSLGNGKLMLIISKKNPEIANKIITTLQRGVTELSAKGMYTSTSYGVLLCAVRKQEVYKTYDMIHEIDPGAFIIVTDAKEIRGEGFVGIK